MSRLSFLLSNLLAAVSLMLFSAAVVAQSGEPASYVKPGLDLSVYQKLILKPLNVSSIEVLKPEWEKDNTDYWTLQISNLRKIQSMFESTMKRELETNGGYTLVRDTGPDVLRIEIEILSITPYVKPGTPGRNGRYKIQTLGSGDVVFSAEFRDSRTRELLALVEGERTIGDTYQELSPENHDKNLESLFTKWGVKIRETLDKSRENQEVK